MIPVLLRKIALYVLALCLVIVLNFGMIRLMPGDALVHLVGEEGYARLSAEGPEALAEVRAKFGLDDAAGPGIGRYFGKILRGDWGWSYTYGRPVAHVIAQRLHWTLMLLIPAILASALLGGWIGARAGWRSRGRGRDFTTGWFLCLYSIPAYCLGLLLQAAASRAAFIPLAGMTPDSGSGWETAGRMILPFITLVVQGTSYKYLIMKNAVCQELGEPYVLTALSKGLSGRRVLFGHILKNTLPPYLAVVGLNVGFMAGGALMVEVVFSWQGMGALMYQAVQGRDYPVLSGSLLVLAFSVFAANLTADLGGALSDPRIREGKSVV